MPHVPATRGPPKATKGYTMDARIDRMMNELHAEPSLRFFQSLVQLSLPGRDARGIDPVTRHGILATLVNERVQGGDDHGMAVDFKEAA